MEFNFPIYPFIWNYDDMYNFLDYNSQIIEEFNNDKNLDDLINIFNNYKIINVSQKILKINAKNLSIHTWYLKKNNLFEKDDNNLKIITDSKIKFKDNVPCLVFDPNNLFERLDYHKDNLTIVKNINSIKKNNVSKLYIHTHNIKGIFRFSPNNNSKIIFNKDINDGIFYIILNNIIIKFNIFLV
jgi:hypothetical protein